MKKKKAEHARLIMLVNGLNEMVFKGCAGGMHNSTVTPLEYIVKQLFSLNSTQNCVGETVFGHN